ncbi:MAG: hypothetical protein MJ132_01535, partial [Clostridia bacterium]|nr:hypothetical protein [Clostridia bacterium]
MTKRKWSRAVALALAVAMLFGMQKNVFPVKADAHLLSVAVDSKYIASGSGSGESVNDPIKIKRTIPDLLPITCSDSTLDKTSTYVYVYDAAVKDPAIGSTDFKGYSDYFSRINKTIPSYYGTRSKNLIADGWGASAEEYATTKKPMDKTYVVTLWKSTNNCIDKLYFRFCNEDGTFEEDHPHFTNTVTSITGPLTLTYKDVDLTQGTSTIMLYRWSPSWNFSNERSSFLNDSGFNSYTALAKSEGSVKYSLSFLNHYGSGKYVAVLGGPGWKNYDEFVFDYTVTEDPNAKTISMTSTLLAEGVMTFDIKTKNTTSKDWIAIYPKGFTSVYQYYDYLYANGTKTTFPSGSSIRYKLDPEWLPLKAGEYVAVLFENDTYSEIARVEFKAVANLTVKKIAVSSTSYVVGDKVNITTTDFSAADKDFIKIVANDSGKCVYDSTADGIKNVYSVSSAGWATGTYTVSAYTKGSTDNLVAQTTFSIKATDDKMVTLSKTVWFTNEDLIIKTRNWSATDKDFLRIYKTPITGGYNSGFLYQTYGDYGKSQYTVPLTGWEEGNYVLIAWDHGDYSKPTVANIEFSIQVASEIEGDENYKNDGSEITILNNCKMDFTNCGHKEIAGKLFNGWVDLDGETVANNSMFSAGTILKASYVDVNGSEQKDFAIIDTMIRTEGKLGLRFIVEKSNSLCEQVD